MIKLQKYERFYINEGFFIIKKGRVLVKDILPNGKVVTNETALKEGEIIGNFFDLFATENPWALDIGIEIEALETTTLEKFSFSVEEIKQNLVFEKMISQLIKRSTIKFLYQLYDKKGYLLAILKLYSDSNGKIPKKDIRYENFNISKSQFYHLFSKLKAEGFLEENAEHILLNLDKIDQFLDEDAY